MYFEQNNTVLIFSLPALYQFLSQNPVLQMNCSYLQFRRQIYHSTVNFELQQIGSLVQIHKSNSQHDLTLYKFHQA